MIKLANASTSNTSEDKQVKVCDYYDRKWNLILRSSKYANGIAFISEKLCNNDNVLYSQEKRLTLNNFLKERNYDINKINTKLYCDCSSFVATCINVNGGKIDVATFTTSTMRGKLLGQSFQAIDFNKSKLIKGDIIVEEGHHTAIVISSNVSSSDIGIVRLQDKNSYLNIRGGKSTDSVILGKLKHNEQVKILNRESEWLTIQKDNVIGFVSSKYIDSY